VSHEIAITGVGLACALGLSADETWRAVRAGRCGTGAMSAIECALPEGRDGCQAPELPEDFEPALPREARYLRWAILSALRDAGARSDEDPPESPRLKPWASSHEQRRAIVLGTTLHGMRAAGRFLRSIEFAELQNFLAGDTLRLATRGLGLNAGAATTCSACSSSLGSVALAVTLLESGEADLVVAGGYDAISEYVWGGFNALRLVADGPMRPFSRGRQGMKLGEGYGIVVLERASDARKRKAKIQAVIAGWGESADAHHLTQPHPVGDGAHRAMRAAIESAGIEPSDLGMIAAHATGTPDNDAAEFRALNQLLGERLHDTPVVCFKSHLGHTLGGAGAAELILSMLSMRDGIVPACANVNADEIEFEGLHVNSSAVDREISYTLNTSLGFGGANTCIVLAKPQAAASNVRRSTHRDVVITGVGALIPGAIGNHAFLSRVMNSHPSAWEQPLGELEDSDFEHLLNARRVRRMSSYVKIMLAAATIACHDAGLIDRPELLSETSAILGTMHGSSGFSYDYYSQIVREGVLTANPMLFAEGVPNVGAAQLSLMLGLKGACQSIIGTRTAGLDALRFAYLRIESGAAERVIVGAAEERHPVVDQAYERCGLRAQGTSSAPFGDANGFVSSAGGAALVVESRESAVARGATICATIDGAASQSGDREELPRTLVRVLADSAPTILSSANATWLDRAESVAVRTAKPQAAVRSVYGATGEIYSASALLAIVATLLKRKPGQFTSLCADWTGCASAVTFRTLANSNASR
jgi:3-oxoacyl-[acyl-carrier-protein] synthase II